MPGVNCCAEAKFWASLVIACKSVTKMNSKTIEEVGRSYYNLLTIVSLVAEESLYEEREAGEV